MPPLSNLVSQHVTGADSFPWHILSLQAAELDVADPSIPFDCAQLLVLLLPPSQEAR